MTNQLAAQVKRFQALASKTGTIKTSSYSVNIYFGMFDDKVTISWGCYDIGYYPRHYETSCNPEEIVEHMEEEISKMEKAVEDYESEDLE